MIYQAIELIKIFRGPLRIITDVLTIQLYRTTVEPGPQRHNKRIPRIMARQPRKPRQTRIPEQPTLFEVKADLYNALKQAGFKVRGNIRTQGGAIDIAIMHHHKPQNDPQSIMIVVAVKRYPMTTFDKRKYFQSKTAQKYIRQQRKILICASHQDIQNVVSDALTIQRDLG